MRVFRIHRVRPGAVLARNVYLGETTLVAAGLALTPRLLEQLRGYGIQTLYVSEDGEIDHQVDRQPDLITEKTRADAARALRIYMEDTRRRLVTSARPISEVVNLILEEVLSNRTVLLELGEIRAMNDYVFGHSVAVCATSTLLGIHLGLDQIELKGLAVGAILHDVGKVRVEEAVWNKPGRLTPEEFRQVQQHAKHGFDIIRAHHDLDLRSAHVAYQHHERWDGQGYPRGLAGDEIHRFARIVSVADVFDALITDRPYRPAWARHRAIGFIQAEAGHMFDPDVVRTFLGRVAPYPVGTVVRLNTGELGKVVRLNARLPARPVVRLLGAASDDLDLAEALDQRIVGPADEEREGPGADPFEGRGEF
ncbi:HD-GYP domain-containing protein [Limnochorda pilosa]|uniref:Phosphohydrolase n=1 Tax=Limnochorda pilosa TaxID=1555112 RepID=A0A0K2SN76_LIMPI|nr:HD-GYP domain-containing protein [Limnochorda pilosa]BAS28565.1 phosphohydrolase [Limnochorda pilosa]